MIKFIEIKSIEYINNLQWVNDISVENNHNYIANRYLVHNCITSSNVSVHYPQASLIDECYNIKKELRFNITRTSAYESETTYNYEFPKIIADGGIRNYDHVIKALALGADYVMIGSLFGQCIESAGEKGIFLGDNKYNKLPNLLDKYKYFERDHNNNWYGFYDEKYINNKIEVYANEYYKIKEWLDKNIINEENIELKRTYNEYMSKFKELKSRKFIGNMYVKFFGMASADGQKSISGQKTKTAEGITKWLPVKYTLVGWVENMKSYLCSAMSYTDCKTINEFIGKPYLIVNSISEINAVNK